MLTLALALAANSTTFSLLDALVLRPYRGEPDLPALTRIANAEWEADGALDVLPIVPIAGTAIRKRAS